MTDWKLRNSKGFLGRKKTHQNYIKPFRESDLNTRNLPEGDDKVKQSV